MTRLPQLSSSSQAILRVGVFGFITSSFGEEIAILTTNPERDASPDLPRTRSPRLGRGRGVLNLSFPEFELTILDQTFMDGGKYDEKCIAGRERGHEWCEMMVVL